VGLKQAVAKITVDPPQPADDFFLSLSRRGLEIDPAGELIWMPHPDPVKAAKGAVVLALPVRDRK